MGELTKTTETKTIKIFGSIDIKPKGSASQARPRYNHPPNNTVNPISKFRLFGWVKYLELNKIIVKIMGKINKMDAIIVGIVHV